MQRHLSGSQIEKADLLTLIDSNEAHSFTWGFKAMLSGVNGDASDSVYVETFQGMFVEAWNEANADGDVHAESSIVDSVAPGFVESSFSLRAGSSGSYTYNGGADYSCRRCSPGFVSFSSTKDVLKALIGNEDFETLLTSKLVASGKPAFSSLSKINVAFSPIPPHDSVVAMNIPVEKDETQTFEWGFKVMLKDVNGDASDASCVSTLEAKFAEAWNEANADVQAESVHVDSVTPGFVETSSSLHTGTLGSYTYNGGADYSCRRCSPGVISFVTSADGLLKALIGNKDFESLLAEKLVASGEPAFASLTAVNVVFFPVHFASTALNVSDNGVQMFSWGYKAMVDGVSGDGETSDCIAAFCSSFVAAWNDAHVDGDVHAETCSVSSVSPGFVVKALRSGTTGNYNYNGGADYSCRRCSPGFLSFSSTEEVVKAITGSDFETALASSLSASACSAFATITDVKVVFIPKPQSAAAELDASTE